MERPQFEIVYLPKHTEAIPKLYKKLKDTEEFEKEVKKILKSLEIVPRKIFLKEKSKGKGKDGTLTEGFRYYRKFKGKIRGKKKEFLKARKWKADFYFWLFYGDNKDGFMFRLDKDGEEMAVVGEKIYNKLLKSIIEQNGALNWNETVSTGNLRVKTEQLNHKGFPVPNNYNGTWAPALPVRTISRE